MEHRVAITGIGAVTPLGNTAKETWEGMKARPCGIGPITHFDTENFKVKVAAEVKDFNGAELLGKQEAAHLDLFSQYALVASDEAMADSGLDAEDAIDRERLGVYVGSGVGGINAFADNVHVIAERGPRRASPVHDHDDDRQHGLWQHRHPPQGARTHPARRDCLRHLRPRRGRGLPRDQARLRRRDPGRRRRGGSCPTPLPASRAAAPSPPTPTPPPRVAPSTRSATACHGRGRLRARSRAVGARRRARRAHLRRGRGLRQHDDAYHITRPDPEASGITRAIRLAVEEGGVKPEEGLYINAHGTSTKLNDASETRGFKRTRRDARAHVIVHQVHDRAHDRRDRRRRGHGLRARARGRRRAAHHRTTTRPTRSATSTTPPTRP